jgi:hypothetical protein
MSWSPDGKYLAVADSGPKAALVPGTKIFFIHVESGERRESKIEVPGPYVLAPAFSPDGKYLAFISGPGFLSNDVYVAPVSGGKSRALTSFHAIMNGLAWTADGRQLVFDSNHQGSPTLWRVPLPGGNPEPLSAAADYAIQPHDCGTREPARVPTEFGEHQYLECAAFSVGSRAADPNRCLNAGKFRSCILSGRPTHCLSFQAFGKFRDLCVRQRWFEPCQIDFDEHGGDGGRPLGRPMESRSLRFSSGRSWGHFRDQRGRRLTAPF